MKIIKKSVIVMLIVVLIVLFSLLAYAQEYDMILIRGSINSSDEVELNQIYHLPDTAMEDEQYNSILGCEYCLRV